MPDHIPLSAKYHLIAFALLSSANSVYAESEDGNRSLIPPEQTSAQARRGPQGAGDPATQRPRRAVGLNRPPQDQAGNPNRRPGSGPQLAAEELDGRLRDLIAANGLSGNPAADRQLPNITDPLPQLGKLLFFSKSLGGGFDAACASCHHPSLGGGDDLSLPVGVAAIKPNLLGKGRQHVSGVPLVPRNSPTIFNIGLLDSGLFMDSRVESLSKAPGENGEASGIRTPDTSFGVADTDAGVNLVAAQAKFPVTSVDEMKTAEFEPFGDNDAIRYHLAARIGNYDIGTGQLADNQWLGRFQAAYNTSDDPETLITYQNIAHAIGEYERSMVFINNPWKQYVEGDNTKLNNQQKRGAILFYTSTAQGGGGCNACHGGDNFSDGRHHTIAFPQIGPGKGDGSNHDFGRERETGNIGDRFHFRTPSLLNVAVTAPYTHSGAYQSLTQVIRHYRNPNNAVNNFFNRGAWCRLPQFRDIENCSNLYPNARSNSQLALQQLREEMDAGITRFTPARLNRRQISQVAAFLNSLTDPCVIDVSCTTPWVPDPNTTGPDGQQLNGVNREGDFL